MTEPRMGKRVQILDALTVERKQYKEQLTSSGALIGNRLSDGAGLYLYITPAGAKSWRFSYRFPKGGKNHVVVYGAWPDLSLSEARKAHARARLQLASGLNPAAEKKKNAEHARAAQELEQQAKRNTFRAVAKDWYDEATAAREKEKKPYSSSWKENTDRWLGWANDEFGNKPLPEIEASDVLPLIKRIAAKTPRSAEGCRLTISTVFDYGIRNLKAPKGFNPAQAIQGALILPGKKHHKKLGPKEIPEFLTAVDKYEGREALKIGLKLLLHCFPRKRELSEAPWSEIDFDAALWTIQAARTKSRNSDEPRDHLIPLSTPTLSMFRRLKELAGDSPYVLPSVHWKRLNRPIGELGLNQTLEAIGYAGKFSPHGVRSTAASILADAGWDENVVDAQLGHKRQSTTRRAYFRNEYMEQRRALMAAWSALLESYAAGTSNVVPINIAKAA